MRSTTYGVVQLVEQKQRVESMISDLEHSRAVISTHSGYSHKRQFISGTKYEPMEHIVVSEILSFIDDKISKHKTWLNALNEDIAELNSSSGRKES